MRTPSALVVGVVVFFLALTASSLAPNDDRVGLDFPTRGRGLPHCYVLTTGKGEVVSWSAKRWLRNASYCFLLALTASGARQALGGASSRAEEPDE